MVGDREEVVTQNRAHLASEIQAHHLVIPVQTHSANLAWIDSSNTSISHENTDGLLTAEPGVCIAVMSADCVPLLLYAPDKHMVAAVHAGWRGTVQLIGAKAVNELIKAGADPKQMLAFIGPSISQQSYEVGGEVIAEMQRFPEPYRILKFTSEDKACCNLWEANRQQLVASGLKNENIEISGLCTATRTDLFFSARKEKPVTGRFAAGIMIV